MTVEFRLARATDLDRLLAMMSGLYANDGVPFDEERSRGAAVLLMKDPRAGALWVIEIDGAVGGYLVLTYGFSLEHGGWHGFVDEFFVMEPYRGQGVGSRAVAHAAEECRRRGMTSLLLEADLQNEGATRLYRRLGFVENPRRLMVLGLG